MPLCICVLLALLVSHESVLSLQPARSLQMSPDYTGSPFYPKELYCHMAFGSGMESKKRYGGTKKIDLQGFEEIEGTRRYLCSKYKNPKKRRNHNPKEKQRKTWKGESHHETNQTQTVCDAKREGRRREGISFWGTITTTTPTPPTATATTTTTTKTTKTATATTATTATTTTTTTPFHRHHRKDKEYLDYIVTKA